MSESETAKLRMRIARLMVSGKVIADRLGISPALLSRILRNERTLTPDRRDQIHAILDEFEVDANL